MWGDYLADSVLLWKDVFEEFFPEDSYGTIVVGSLEVLVVTGFYDDNLFFYSIYSFRRDLSCYRLIFDG